MRRGTPGISLPVAMTLPDPHRFSEGVRERCAGSAETLDLIERDVDAWVRRFKVARAMALYEERRLREVGTRTARRQIGHLFASVAIRIVDLASGMTLLINENHAHAAFATARSLVETAGVPAYVVKNVVPQLKRGGQKGSTRFFVASPWGLILASGLASLRAQPANIAIRSGSGHSLTRCAVNWMCMRQKPGRSGPPVAKKKRNLRALCCDRTTRSCRTTLIPITTRCTCRRP